MNTPVVRTHAHPPYPPERARTHVRGEGECACADTKPTYILTLVPIPERLNREPAIRLKRLLKLALRQCGLRAVTVREGNAITETQTAGAPGKE